MRGLPFFWLLIGQQKTASGALRFFGFCVLGQRWGVGKQRDALGFCGQHCAFIRSAQSIALGL
jgi:hypothetical protein